MTGKYKNLAKLELHCHLDGSLSLDTIKQLADMAKIEYPKNDNEFKKLVTVTKDANSLIDYLKTFDFIRPLLQTKEALRLAAYDVAKHAALENVIYLELRYAPELSMDEGLTALETLEAVLEGLKDAHKEFGIEGKAIVCGLKHTPFELTKDIFENVVHLADKGLAGFDFAGDEENNPVSELEKAIKETQKLGLPLTFHAGECGCVKNIVDALNLGIKRIGHGTALALDDEAIKLLVEKGAAVEMCLTSNIQTKAMPSLEEFHYKKLYDAGAKITISTDNRTVSDTNLTKEYSLFNKYFGTETKDFYCFNKNAVEVSFTDEEQKQRLFNKLKKNYKDQK
ncbi:adenosine deaminase [Gemelliphila palaticanis]|uniref:Adenosine deaminase n=1 Tax=Gemelliphila palaticanis TaxID=81950 RepID=A0ABX2SZ12_9BACL|nr:adenosine deaminase [Gemella palaticanis]MBF0715357.1 adenosine deaminase [Gemella palaticanis]NYS47287.1 adenosine deaminase [Gemella palaticanis]